MPDEAAVPRVRSPDDFDRDDLLTLVAARLEALGHHAEYLPGTARAYRHDELRLNGVEVGLTAYQGRRNPGWFVSPAFRHRVWIARGLGDGYRVAERVARWLHEHWGDIEREEAERRRREEARKESEALAARCRRLSEEAARRCGAAGLAVSPCGAPDRDGEARVYVRLNGDSAREALPWVAVGRSRLTDAFVRDALRLQARVRRMAEALLRRHGLADVGAAAPGADMAASGAGP